MQDAFRFLKGDDSFVPDVSLRSNVSGHPKYKTLDGLLRRQSRIKHAAKITCRRGCAGVSPRLSMISKLEILLSLRRYNRRFAGN